MDLIDNVTFKSLQIVLDGTIVGHFLWIDKDSLFEARLFLDDLPQGNPYTSLMNRDKPFQLHETTYQGTAVQEIAIYDAWIEHIFSQAWAPGDGALETIKGVVFVVDDKKEPPEP